MFQSFGQIESTVVPKKKNGECKGWSFVNFFTEVAAEKAIKSMNGYKYESMVLRVEWPRKKGNIMNITACIM